ncbi:MAG: hypothetical protein ACNS60_05470 [Candidatus Cyclobacteriaceae bacterium M2_1C_046]
MEKNKEKRVRQESDRVKEERRVDNQDEAQNPTTEAMETGKEQTPESKATRNVNSYENEFGSKKAGPGGYGDRPKKQPATDRKREQDKEERERENKNK